MNTLYAFLFALVTYTNAANSNSIGALSAEDFARYCYYCSNCPVPFFPRGPSVIHVFTTTGWCATMSNSSTPGALATRGTAQPNLCSYFGCRWTPLNRVYTYICCCNTNLCNGDSPMTTTIKPYTTTCYYCSHCPTPFYQYDIVVSTTVSSTDWCAKMGTSSSIYEAYSRGAAQPGLCSRNGCSWRYVNDVNTYVCCCNHYLCNTGVPTSRSIVAVLNTAFMTTILTFKSF